MCFGIRILSPFHLGTLQIPIQNQKCLKNALLQHRALPEVRAGNGGTLNGLTWMQNGAPPHASDLNIHYLARQFGGGWLQGGGAFRGKGLGSQKPGFKST